MTETERFETDLPPDLAEFVRARAGHGTLASGSDVLREAVRQAAEREARHAATRRRIEEGVQALRAAPGVDGETFMAALDAELAEKERRGR